MTIAVFPKNKKTRQGHSEASIRNELVRLGKNSEMNACLAILRRIVPALLQRILGIDDQLLTKVKTAPAVKNVASPKRSTGKIPKQTVHNELELPHPRAKKFKVKYPNSTVKTSK